MSDTTDVDPGRPTDLSERYGAPAPWRRQALIGVVATVVVAFGGWLAWTTWVQARPLAASGELRFVIVDSSRATATFTLELRDPTLEATCMINAYAADHSLVGSVSFVAEPSPSGTVVHDVSTERQASAIELLGCTAPGQNRPR